MAAEKGNQLSSALSQVEKKALAFNAALENLAGKVKLAEQKAAAARKSSKPKR